MGLTREKLLELKEELLKLNDIKSLEKMLPGKSAYDFLVECSADRLDSYAVNYLGRKYTYRELIEKIDIAAKGFSSMGIKPEDMVAMGMLSTPEAIITFYALNKIGATVYMINATHEKHAIKEELLDSAASVLIINDIFYDKDIKQFADEVGVKHVVTVALDESLPLPFKDKAKFKFVETIKKIGNACKIDPRCIKWSEFMNISQNLDIYVESYYRINMKAVLASTSGSTGNPKRPVMTNENMNSMPIQMGMTCDAFAPGDSIFTTLPCWILYSLFNSIHEPLCLGVTVDLDPLFSSKKVSDRFKLYKFNHWNTIPSYIEDMLKDKKLHNLTLGHLKTITTGGDFRTPKLKELAEKKLKENGSECEVGQGYGLSELGGSFCYTYENNMPAASVGKPLFGNRFKIVDLETGELCGPNQIGELYLYSPTLMMEYYKNEEATSISIVTDENSVRWYKTEDTAHYDENGCLFLDGRLRRIEISRDANGVPTKVFPDKVKQVVSRHPMVDTCEIIMVPDDKRITRPVAYIVMKTGYELDGIVQMQINQLCVENNIESYTIPTEYIAIDEIPKTPGLKTNLDALKEMYANNNINELKKTKSLINLLRSKVIRN